MFGAAKSKFIDYSITLLRGSITKRHAPQATFEEELSTESCHVLVMVAASASIGHSTIKSTEVIAFMALRGLYSRSKYDMVGPFYDSS